VHGFPGHSLRGATVLDAYAGSGALGLEALSRGAQHVTFVESGGPAASIVQTNAGDLDVASRCTVFRDTVERFLDRATDRFTLALLDPPYDIPRMELANVLEALAPRLEDGARVVLEWSTRAGTPPWPSGIVGEASKKYGETTVHYAGAGEAADAWA